MTLQQSTTLIELNKFCEKNGMMLPEPKTKEEIEELNNWYKKQTGGISAVWYPNYRCSLRVAYFSDGTSKYTLSETNINNAECDGFYYYHSGSINTLYGVKNYAMSVTDNITCEYKY